MSIKLCCSLCCAPCSEYKLLQNEVGECNEIYEITVKYFDPMLLTEERNINMNNENKILCLECWYHIKDFHEFQQTVIKARNQLEETDVKQIPPTLEQLEVKVEQKDQDNNTTSEDDAKDFDKSDEEEFSQFEDVYMKNDLDECDENNEDDSLAIREGEEVDDDDEEEKPLIQLRRTKKPKELKKENGLTEKMEKDNENDKDKNTTSPVEKPKSKRGRKPKGYIKDDIKHESGDENDSGKSAKKKKKLKPPKEVKVKDKNTYNLEKGKELDVFISEWKPQLECDLCSETAPNFEKLRAHFREIHKVRCYIKCCERKFFRRYVLADHIRLHINPETHKCDICGKSSSSKYNLKLHKKIMHEDTQNYECEECHRVFNQKPTLDRHLLTHVTGNKDFVCQDCGKGYVLEVQLKSHIRTVHNVDRVCDQCGKTIHGVGALKKHLMEHAGIEKPKFPCDECGMELNSHHGLKRHKAAYHHDGTTIFVCGICGKVAASENALKMHKKHVHMEERKHKCTYCDKAFKRPKVLREHIATHTGQDLYQCPHCPQTFKVSANMHHHRKKVHPIEWEEGRKGRLQLPKVNINQVKNQVVI